MTPAEEGAYIRLLAYQWQDKTGTLPADPERLGAMSRLGRSYFEGASKVLRGTFEKVPGVEGRIYNKRLFDDWKREVEGRMRMAAGGIKSGETRRNKNRNVTKELQGTFEAPSKHLGGTFDNLPAEKKGGERDVITSLTSKTELTKESLCSDSSSHTEAIASPVIQNSEFQLTNPDQSDSKKRTPTADWAERIYQAYPRRVAKQNALKAIRKALKLESPEVLLEATEAFAAVSSRWPAEQREYIPHPASWFNAGRYADDRADWERKTSKNPLDNPPQLDPEIMDQVMADAATMERGDV